MDTAHSSFVSPGTSEDEMEGNHNGRVKSQPQFQYTYMLHRCTNHQANSQFLDTYHTA